MGSYLHDPGHFRREAGKLSLGPIYNRTVLYPRPVVYAAFKPLGRLQLQICTLMSDYVNWAQGRRRVFGMRERAFLPRGGRIRRIVTRGASRDYPPGGGSE